MGKPSLARRLSHLVDTGLLFSLVGHYNYYPGDDRDASSPHRPADALRLLFVDLNVAHINDFLVPPHVESIEDEHQDANDDDYDSYSTHNVSVLPDSKQNRAVVIPLIERKLS
jgi:hypothetical protein